MNKHLLFILLFLLFLTSCKEKKQEQTSKETAEPQLVFGRQVPERKDDFAWENDRMAYRVYGPALVAENPSNGIDIWLKKTDSLIVDKFYRDDLQNGISYHVDHGLGLDCYKVGHTLGAGAIAPFADGKIWVENHYTTAEVLSLTPKNITFQLIYDGVQMDDKLLNKKVVVSLDAGSQFNKATVTYDGDFDSIQLAAGIFLHDGSGIVHVNREKGFITYAENATSDFGVPAGRNYVGVIFTTPILEIYQDDVHIAGVVDYKKGDELVYYFGAGWSEWGFPSDEDWDKNVDEYRK